MCSRVQTHNLITAFMDKFVYFNLHPNSKTNNSLGMLIYRWTYARITKNYLVVSLI